MHPTCQEPGGVRPSCEDRVLVWKTPRDSGPPWGEGTWASAPVVHVEV